MKSLIKFFVCGFFFFSLSYAFAQQQGFSTQVLYFQDSSYLGANDSAIVKIKNLDTSSYSGYINIYYTTDTATFTSVLFCIIPSISLNGLDSVVHTCYLTFDSTYYNIGNNIVVVWSSGNAKAPADSIWVNVYLDSPLVGIYEVENALFSTFTIYPTFTKDFITIESSENILPKKIFIEDVTGRIISVITPFPDLANRIKINTSELKSGIYFLDILLPDKQRVVSKFVKTD